MPSQDFERAAISAFCKALAEQTGERVQVVEHPEDTPNQPVTVDAVVDHEGEFWAVDHVRLVYEPAVIPANAEAERVLIPTLRDLASRHNKVLYVSVMPPRRATSLALSRRHADIANRG
jgi:hypothetical protein